MIYSIENLNILKLNDAIYSETIVFLKDGRNQFNIKNEYFECLMSFKNLVNNHWNCLVGRSSLFNSCLFGSAASRSNVNKYIENWINFFFAQKMSPMTIVGIFKPNKKHNVDSKMQGRIHRSIWLLQRH